MNKSLGANEGFWKEQVLPIFLTAVTALFLCLLLLGEVKVLNWFTREDIYPQIRIGDVLLGLTIYLKTAVDFAIFIARLMDANGGWRSRVAIELGTAVGNFAGTGAILLLWDVFREVEVLLALMILIASLVLFRLAEDGLEHAKSDDKKYPDWFQGAVNNLELALSKVNASVAPILKYVIPHTKMGSRAGLRFWPLFVFSFTVPFILGLDDFAGYVPLFNIVNVYGFAVGVILGHMILNVLLYLSPKRTVRIVKNPIISFLGSVVFVGLAVWGIIEVVKILYHVV